jgi:hypothetical protein
MLACKRSSYFDAVLKCLNTAPTGVDLATSVFNPSDVFVSDNMFSVLNMTMVPQTRYSTSVLKRRNVDKTGEAAPPEVGGGLRPLCLHFFGFPFSAG